MRVAFEQFKHVAELAPIGIQIINSSGQSLYVNEKYTDLFGANSANRNILDDTAFSSADVPNLIKQAFAGQNVQIPTQWRTVYGDKNQRRIAIESKIVPILEDDGAIQKVVCMYNDVTAQMLLHEETQRAAKERDDAYLLVQTVINEARAVVYLKSLEGRFIFANGQFCRIFNKPIEEIVGKSDYELFPKDIADTFRKNDLEIQRTNTHVEYEEVAMHYDGTPHNYISLKFPLYDSNGALVGVGGISTDITQHKKLEHELSIAKRMESIGLLAGGVAHDFNNTLGIIMLVADTLLMTGGDEKPEWKSAIETLRRSAQSAALLTRKLLAFGKKQPARPAPQDLGILCQNTWSLLKNAIGDDIQTSFSMEPNLWPVYGDPSQIEQILTNLCFNAKEAMPSGGRLQISISNQRQPSHARWRLTHPINESVELAITDTGRGMSPETIERIFEPFFTTKADGLGSGLGLATVYDTLNRMGGNIAVESKLGSGSTFRVLFPRYQGDEPTWVDKSSPQQMTLRGNETILLVEDQDALSSATAQVLKEFGYNVLEAASAEAGLEIWSIKRSQIDLILADVVMPGKSGFEMLKEMTLQGGKTNLRVLFVSAYSEKKLSDYKFDSSDFHFLQKPYTSSQLLQKLREVLKA